MNRLHLTMPTPPATSTEPVIVVVVEDEELVRMIAIEFLTDEGFIAIEAEHAEDAVSILESQADDVHIVFSDHLMPGPMNGMALVHHVSHHWPWISLILTSGNIRPQSADLPSGCRFLPKPYRSHHVVRHIRELMADK